MNQLTVTKESVLKAAETCPQAKEVLQTLFPTAFDNSVDLTNRSIDDLIGQVVNSVYYPQHAFKSYHLSEKYDWTMRKVWSIDNSRSALLLIPTIKLKPI